MIILRLIAIILCVAALMLLGADVVSSLEGGAVRIRALAELVALFGGPALDALRASIETALPAPVPMVLLAVLEAPASAVIGVTGVILAILVRRRD